MRIIEIANTLIGLMLLIAGVSAFLYVIKQVNNDTNKKGYVWFTIASIALFVMGVLAIYDTVATYFMYSL